MSRYCIVAKDLHQANNFAENNNMMPDDWYYAKSQKDFKDKDTVILVHGWKRSRCILMQGLITASLVIRGHTVLNMEETERLS